MNDFFHSIYQKLVKKFIFIVFSILLIGNSSSNQKLPYEKIRDYSFLNENQKVFFSFNLNLHYLKDNFRTTKDFLLKQVKKINLVIKRIQLKNIYKKEFLKSFLRFDHKNQLQWLIEKNNKKASLQINIETQFILKHKEQDLNFLEITSLIVFSKKQNYLKLKRESSYKNILSITDRNLEKHLERDLLKVIKISILKNLEFIFYEDLKKIFLQEGKD